jgi:amino acid permease
MHEVLIFSVIMVILLIYKFYFRMAMRSHEIKASFDIYTYLIASIGVFIIYRFLEGKLNLY